MGNMAGVRVCGFGKTTLESKKGRGEESPNCPTCNWINRENGPS